MEATFDGLPLTDLTFSAVDWSLTQEHVEKRYERKGTHEFAPTVEAATEACGDPHRLVGRTTNAVVVIGFAPASSRLLRVVLQPEGHAGDGRWVGLTAHAANARDQKRYGGSP